MFYAPSLSGCEDSKPTSNVNTTLETTGRKEIKVSRCRLRFASLLLDSLLLFLLNHL